MNRNKKKNLTIYRISDTVENRRAEKNRRSEQKIGKANHKLRSQNYRFACDQNTNKALKSATNLNEPRKYAN